MFRPCRVYSWPEAYAHAGYRDRSQRYLCKACRKTFSVPLKLTARQKAPHLNRPSSLSLLPERVTVTL